MSLVEKVIKLCEEKNMSQGQLEKELGFSRSSVRKWDDSSPSMDKVVAVADFFHVSVDWLMGKAENRTTPEDLKRWSEDEEIQDVVRSYEGDDDMKLLFKTSKSLSPEKKKQAIAVLRALRGDDE